MIPITDTLYILETEIEERFIRASGPGGQNVNKVASAVQLRFNVEGSVTLPEDVKKRLSSLAGRRMTEDGFLIIEAREHRSQEMNRKEALSRLLNFIRRAANPPKLRKPTRPSQAAKRRRLESKLRRSRVKNFRKTVLSHEE